MGVTCIFLICYTLLLYTRIVKPNTHMRLSSRLCTLRANVKIVRGGAEKISQRSRDKYLLVSSRRQHHDHHDQK